MKKKSSFYTIIFYACLAVIIVVAVAALFMNNNAEEPPVYSDIIGYFEKDSVKEFVIKNNTITATVLNADGTEKEITYTFRDVSIFYNDFMSLKEDGVLTKLEKYDFPPVQERSWFLSYLPMIFSLAFLWCSLFSPCASPPIRALRKEAASVKPSRELPRLTEREFCSATLRALTRRRKSLRR